MKHYLEELQVQAQRMPYYHPMSDLGYCLSFSAREPRYSGRIPVCALLNDITWTFLLLGVQS